MAFLIVKSQLQNKASSWPRMECCTQTIKTVSWVTIGPHGLSPWTTYKLVWMEQMGNAWNSQANKISSFSVTPLIFFLIQNWLIGKFLHSTKYTQSCNFREFTRLVFVLPHSIQQFAGNVWICNDCIRLCTHKSPSQGAKKGRRF